MIVYLNGDIAQETIDKLAEALNKLGKNKTLKIYLNTNGGDANIMEAILQVIDDNKDRVELIGSGFLFSAGFNIFFRATCKRRLVPDTVGMAHFIWTDAEIDQTGRAKSAFGKFQLKEMKRSKKAYIEFFKELGLTSTEINDIKKGNEHYFTQERMKELLNNQDGKNQEKRGDSLGA